MMPRFRFLPVWLVWLCVGVLGINAHALLPKTMQATSVKVFDLNQDLSARNEGACEAYYADLAIQGLVNRTNTDKIYFTNSPAEFSWYEAHTRPPADQELLEDGLIPVPRSKPVLNTNLSYPVLGYLLTNYGSRIHGMVMISDCGSPTNYDGALAAGFTACGILDAIPATAGISNYIASLGLHLPVLADTRGFSSNEAAFAWAYSNYFTTQTCRSVMAYFTPHGYHATYAAEFPDMLDYWVANRMFVFCLNPFVNTQSNLLHTILSPTNYAYGTPIQSIQYEENDGQLNEKFGYCDDIVMAPNISVTCSFPSIPANIVTPTPAVPTTIDQNGVYIGFFLSDGDSFNVALGPHYHNMTRVYTNNTVPVGWSLNPEFFDLFPTLLEYLSRYNANPVNIAAGENTNNLEFIANGFHNSMAVNNGYAPFIDRYKYYQSNTHGMFRTLNITPNVEFGGTGATLAEGEGLAVGAGFFGFISDYQGGLSVVPWVTLDAGNAVCTRLSVPKLGRTDRETPQSIVTGINRNINATSAGQPVFAILCIGANGGSLSSLAPAIAELNANPNGRHFYFLKPSDVEGAWLKWKQSFSNVLVNPNWSPTTINGTDGGRGWVCTSGASQYNDIENAGYFPQTEGLYGLLKAQVDGHTAGDFEYATSGWYPAAAGSLWQASAYFKPESSDMHNSQAGQVVIEFENAESDVIGRGSNVVVNSSSLEEWHFGVVSMTAPAGTTFARMKVGLYDPVADGVSGKVLVDNASLGPVRPPSPVGLTRP